MLRLDPFAGVAGLVTEFGAMFETTGDVTFVPALAYVPPA